VEPFAGGRWGVGHLPRAADPSIPSARWTGWWLCYLRNSSGTKSEISTPWWPVAPSSASSCRAPPGLTGAARDAFDGDARESTRGTRTTNGLFVLPDQRPRTPIEQQRRPQAPDSGASPSQGTQNQVLQRRCSRWVAVDARLRGGPGDGQLSETNTTPAPNQIH